MLAPDQVPGRFNFFSNSLIIHEAHIWAHRVQCVKLIICDAMDPHLKDRVITFLRVGPFNLLCDESNER